MSSTATTATRRSFELQNWSEAGANTIPTSTRREGNTISNWEEDNHVAQQLDPADRGFPAWRLLIGGFVFEALLWGT
jgi:hypothetical protein